MSGALALRETLAASKNNIIVLNDGKMYLPKAPKDGSNLIICNGATGVVRPARDLRATASRRSPPDDGGRWTYRCTTHNYAFVSWQDHFRTFKHYRCPQEGCPSAGQQFATDEMFLRHWKLVHDAITGVILYHHTKPTNSRIEEVDDEKEGEEEEVDDDEDEEDDD